MLDNARFKYNDPSELGVYLKYQGHDWVWRIGLDDQYRQSSDGSLRRGYWKDAATFVVEVFDVGLSTYKFTFTGDQVLVDAPGVTLEGQVSNP